MSIDTEQEALIARWIQPNPHKPGAAAAWVLPHHVSVWAIVMQLQLDGWNVPGVAAWYELPVEAVEAAIEFYQRHKVDVDAKIAHNRAFFGLKP